MINQLGQIISASRRSDIPAFHGEWFLKQVHTGNVDVPNPFSGKSYPVSLAPEDVNAIVFWSKDYQYFFPILDNIDPIYQKRFLFHFTINGYEDPVKQLFEPNIPEINTAINSAKQLAKRYGKEALLWRFDPIIISTLSSTEERIEAFSKLATMLNGVTERCYISFVDRYAKVRQRFEALEQKHSIHFKKPTLDVRIDITRQLNTIAARYGITLYSCCEDDITEAAGIEKGHCIDSKLLSQLYPDLNFSERLKPTRKGCGCYESRDIGTYNSCRHRCLYCYANK